MRRSLTYDFVVPDAGIYWYHPHVMSAAQVGFGLYGAFLVEDSTETETIGIADDLVLVLSDVDVDVALLPADTGGTVGMLFGREGNRVLVNGRRLPELVARSGSAAALAGGKRGQEPLLQARPRRGARLPQDRRRRRLTEYSEDHDFIVLGAGERADVLVTPTGEPGGKGPSRIGFRHPKSRGGSTSKPTVNAPDSQRTRAPIFRSRKPRAHRGPSWCAASRRRSGRAGHRRRPCSGRRPRRRPGAR